MRPRAVGVRAVGALVLACDGVVSGDYAGEPALVLTGGFENRIDCQGCAAGQLTGLAGRDDLRVAVFWAPADAGVDPDAWVEQASSGQTIALPESLRVPLYEAPPAHPDAQGRLAIGRVVVYADLDMSGARDPGEPVLGGVLDVAVLHADGEAPAGLTALSVPPGFAVVPLPLACGAAAACAAGDCPSKRQVCDVGQGRCGDPPKLRAVLDAAPVFAPICAR